MSKPSSVTPGGAPTGPGTLLGEVPEVELATLLGAGHRLVDVRSPEEFATDHIPGARSVPLLGDRERAVVGTLYRHAGPDQARSWAFERVQERVDEFTERLLEGLELDPGTRAEDGIVRAVTCARGGERSGVVVRHLHSRGVPVRRLVGGYRAYRQWVRERLAALDLQRPVVLDGLTGSGKTRLLAEIARRFPRRVIDLEGLAAHRSSLFGDIGLEPVSQKAFESALVGRLDASERDSWTLFEWEARRVGDRELPVALYQQLETATHLEVVADLDQRVTVLCEEYLSFDSGEAIRARLRRLERFPGVGPDGVAHLDRLMAAGRFRDVAAFLLEHHYDPRYRHGAAGRAVAASFRLDTIERTAARIVEWLEAQG